MSTEGIQRSLKGSEFKADLAQIVGHVLTTAAKAFAAAKTGGVSLAFTPNLVSAFFSILKDIKREDTLERRAWLLVSGGLLYAIENSVGELSLKSDPSPDDFARLAKNIAERVETRTYSIEIDFFTDPSKLTLLDDVSHELSSWLNDFGPAASPKKLKTTLQRHFPPGLHRTWMKDAARFAPLEQALELSVRACRHYAKRNGRLLAILGRRIHPTTSHWPRRR